MESKIICVLLEIHFNNVSEMWLNCIYGKYVYVYIYIARIK